MKECVFIFVSANSLQHPYLIINDKILEHLETKHKEGIGDTNLVAMQVLAPKIPQNRENSHLKKGERFSPCIIEYLCRRLTWVILILRLLLYNIYG